MRGRKEVQLGEDGHAATLLGTTVRAWRRSHGFSITGLAERAGYGAGARGYISRIEHGVIREVGDVRLRQLARALGVTPADLRSGRMPTAKREEVAEIRDTTPSTSCKLPLTSTTSLPSTAPTTRPRANSEGTVTATATEGSNDAKVRPEIYDQAVGLLTLRDTNDQSMLADTTPRVSPLERSLADALQRPAATHGADAPYLQGVMLEGGVGQTSAAVEFPATDPDIDRQLSMPSFTPPSPKPVGVFVWHLQAVLYRHGYDLSSLYKLCSVGGSDHEAGREAIEINDSTAKRRLVAPAKVMRLLRAASGEQIGSVTLSPDELEAVRVAFGFNELDMRLLKAALVGEGVFRLLLERVGVHMASEVGHWTCRQAYTESDPTARSVLDRIR